MLIAITLLTFFLGTVFGSFINMAVYRVKHELDFMGRSFCDKTKDPLGVEDLIPIFSFVFSGGKCRKCGHKLSLLYPLVELISGLLLMLSFLHLYDLHGFGIELLINWVVVNFFLLFFLFFAVYDFYYWQVNVRSAEISLVLAVLLVIMSIFQPQLFLQGWSSLLAGIIGGGVIYLIVLLTKGGGMGEGDIYLFALLGLFVGLNGLFPAFLITTISGSLVGIIKAVKIGKLSGVKIQFAPFIAFGAIITFFFFDFLINLFYTDQLIKLLLSAAGV